MQADSATLNNLLCVSWKLNTLNKITETSLWFQNGTRMYLSLFERKRNVKLAIQYLKITHSDDKSMKMKFVLFLILISIIS